MKPHAASPDTPIFDFLRRYEQSGVSRLHMPGHKGNPPKLPGGEKLPFSLDITEIKGADALFEAEGVIGRSEEIAAGLFGVKSTCYSAGGSTLGSPSGFCRNTTGNTACSGPQQPGRLPPLWTPTRK